MNRHEWLLRRLRATETQLSITPSKTFPSVTANHKNPLAQSYDREEKTFARLQTRINATRAAYHRANRP